MEGNEQSIKVCEEKFCCLCGAILEDGECPNGCTRIRL